MRTKASEFSPPPMAAEMPTEGAYTGQQVSDTFVIGWHAHMKGTFPLLPYLSSFRKNTNIACAVCVLCVCVRVWEFG